MFAIPILVPFLAALAILISPLWCITRGNRFEKQNNLKRFGMFLLISFVATAGVCGLLLWGGCLKMYFSEVWNNRIVKITHEEKWTTHETRTETYTTGSGKNQTTHTRTIHYTDTHGPYWKAYTDQGATHTINSGTYNKWMKLWANQKKTGVHKGSSAGLDRSISGNIYACIWPKTFETIYPWASIHRYKNKVRMSDSVLKYSEPTEELMARYPRPADKRNTEPWVAYSGKVLDMDPMLLRRINADMGYRRQIHALLVTFSGDTPRTVVDDVLTAWQGPNKNELVTFVALDGSEVKWVEVHSWMDDTTLHAMLRDRLAGQSWATAEYAKALQDLVPKYWRRKEFEDFDYLKVSIHGGWIFAALVLSLVVVVVTFLALDGRFENMGRRFSGNRYGNRGLKFGSHRKIWSRRSNW
jgi:hypothetical protein